MAKRFSGHPFEGVAIVGFAIFFSDCNAEAGWLSCLGARGVVNAAIARKEPLPVGGDSFEIAPFAEAIRLCKREVSFRYVL